MPLPLKNERWFSSGMLKMPLNEPQEPASEAYVVGTPQ